jgi:2-polyprenyl-3-methyl-5-hydroxy-6-metoxy-1,4-benzoquinol methylase
MYRYANPGLGSGHDFLVPAVLRVLSGVNHKSIFEIGCGNGSVANELTRHGYEVVGIDSSAEGVAVANVAYPHVRIHHGSAYDDLASVYGQFPIVLSLEVVEHLFEPRRFAKTAADLLLPGGTAIISTPYHGYLKNVALAVTGKMDAHHDPLWDGGHIKFWSMRSLAALLSEVGLEDIKFLRVGRIPALAKSMIAVARKP